MERSESTHRPQVTTYQVSLAAPAVEWLERCRDAKLKRRIGAMIDGLATAPRPPGSIKLTAETAVWRVRLGEYRILYEIEDQQLRVWVIRIAKRSEAYR